MTRFARYYYQHPTYHLGCFGFTYQHSNWQWFIMDDFGNAVISDINYDTGE